MGSDVRSTAASRVSGWVGLGVAVVIAVIALVSIWTLALPVTVAGTVCAAIYPPPAGCAGDARLLPGAVWSLLILVAAVGAFLLSRRGWWGVPVGAFIVAVIGFAGYFATLFMNVFLVG